MIEQAVGLKVIVTFNVETDLDVANGARGEVVEIALDERESNFLLAKAVVLNRTKAKVLGNLDSGVLPFVPMQRTFRIMIGGREEVVTQMQLPLTPAYAFTDYRLQGQTISNAIVDIAQPPSGKLAPMLRCHEGMDEKTSAFFETSMKSLSPLILMSTSGLKIDVY
ncbi:uncharacterized protein F5147DRAFT_760444 [Suillus discolor]|uniref:Uncharacterized protein n=1 Tax=Suillus discolor TaxID=1912936 RepID=A0A9P7F922_9AGAM|nr:uncharacterized protein F5147DRAFT_760444 [Suillus discolor]KAG2109848.1 hypothetical protein F5147DRAFT_760444 [Suillus discolor]